MRQVKEHSPHPQENSKKGEWRGGRGVWRCGDGMLVPGLVTTGGKNNKTYLWMTTLAFALLSHSFIHSLVRPDIFFFY